MPVDAAEAAADWWAERLAPAYQDNGDRSELGLVAGVLGGMLSQKDRPDDEQVAEFRRILAERIRERQYERSLGYVCLGVDYGPDPLLGDAARDAGMSTAIFPWKTHTFVYDDKFIASAGYAAERRLVWASDDYKPVPCHVQGYESGTYTVLAGKCSQDEYHEGPHDRDIPSPLCEVCGAPEDHYGGSCRGPRIDTSVSV